MSHQSWTRIVKANHVLAIVLRLTMEMNELILELYEKKNKK